MSKQLKARVIDQFAHARICEIINELLAANILLSAESNRDFYGQTPWFLTLDTIQNRWSKTAGCVKYPDYPGSKRDAWVCISDPDMQASINKIQKLFPNLIEVREVKPFEFEPEYLAISWMVESKICGDIKAELGSSTTTSKSEGELHQILKEVLNDFYGNDWEPHECGFELTGNYLSVQ